VVFAGLAAVVVVLTRGIAAFTRGDKSTSFRMMRYRVIFQAGVAFALMAGVFLRPQSNPDSTVRPGMAADKQYFMDLSEEYRVEDGKPVFAPVTERVMGDERN
jgi:hypothetical protein